MSSLDMDSDRLERDPASAEEDGDLPREEIAQAKMRARINALALLLVLLLTTIAPYPWSLSALLIILFLPLYALVRKVRSRNSPTAGEPYSYVPKDPKDPRRYKPIG
jgi:hypothetical protein